MSESRSARGGNWILLFLLILLSMVATPGVVTAQTVVRGPYLQLGTEDSMIVRWRTSIATDSRVVLGRAPGAAALTVTDPTSVVDHEILVSGLTPATAYFYQVGTTTQLLAGGDEQHVFRTAPAVGATSPVRVWATGDAGTGTPDQVAVRDAYYSYAGLGSTDVWLMLGDNAYPSGFDAIYQLFLFDIYEELLRTTPFWTALGNHDTGDLFDLCTSPTAAEAGGVPSGTEAYYSFNHANIHFVCLNSMSLDLTPTGPMLQWLEADLASHLQEWTIAYWHHPPYTKGSHDSDDVTDSGGRMRDMRENALPILEAGGVDVVLSGHSHVYERSFLISGHHDVSTTFDPLSMLLDGGDGHPNGTGAYQKPALSGASQGAVFVVMGSSGKVNSGSLNHPAMFHSVPLLGSLVLDIEGSTLSGRMIGADALCADVFQIVKGGPSPDFEFQRGDVNGSGTLNIADAVSLLGVLFGDGCVLDCQDAADVNDSGAVNIADPIALLNYLFQQGAPPAPPTFVCGPDPTADALRCSAESGCP